MVVKHEKARTSLGALETQVRKMPKRQNDGSITGIAYCPDCQLPAIDKVTVEKNGKDVAVDWCEFCEKEIERKIASKKRYLTIIQSLKRIYSGLRSNK